ncbi:hypothetical protein JMUB7523_26700 [Staphylococcus aureus]
MIYETAPAKINFTLDTLFKRNDGYHEIEMIMTTCLLYTSPSPRDYAASRMPSSA